MITALYLLLSLNVKKLFIFLNFFGLKNLNC